MLNYGDLLQTGMPETAYHSNVGWYSGQRVSDGTVAYSNPDRLPGLATERRIFRTSLGLARGDVVQSNKALLREYGEGEVYESTVPS